jgi:hypothetical protein
MRSAQFCADLGELLRTEAKARERAGGGDQKSADRVPKVSGSDGERHTRETAAKVGAFAGVSGRTVEKIATPNANRDPRAG